MNDFFSMSNELTTSGGFSLFDRTHLFWLLGMLTVCVLLTICYKRANKKEKRCMGIGIAALTLLLNLFRAMVLLIKGEYDVGCLPLHLCAMSVYIEFVYAIFPNKYLGEFLYAACMPGALAAMLMPNWTDYPFLNFMHICCFGIHLLLVAYPVMLVCSGELCPNPRRLPICAAALAVICVPIYFFNKHFGTNFMFLNVPAPGSPLVWFYQKLGSPHYLIGFPVMAAALWIMLYTPVCIKNRIKNRRQMEND